MDLNFESYASLYDIFAHLSGVVQTYCACINSNWNTLKSYIGDLNDIDIK
jgi:hypothetical protein